MNHFEVYKTIAKLKELERRGWVQRNVSGKLGGARVESAAEHAFSTGLFALYIMGREKLQLDETKVMKMIFFHDIGEGYIGDITPADKVPKEIKYKLEKEAVEKFVELSSMDEIFDIWQEFEAEKTPEAKFVKKLDRLDAVMQAKLYSEKIGDDNKIFNEFFTTAEKSIGDFLKYID